VNSLKAADGSCSVRVEHAALSWLEYPRYFIKQLNREAKHLGAIIPLMMLNARELGYVALAASVGVGK
jgi:hypothetical protein